MLQGSGATCWTLESFQAHLVGAGSPEGQTAGRFLIVKLEATGERGGERDTLTSPFLPPHQSLLLSKPTWKLENNGAGILFPFLMEQRNESQDANLKEDRKWPGQLPKPSSRSFGGRSRRGGGSGWLEGWVRQGWSQNLGGGDTDFH